MKIITKFTAAAVLLAFIGIAPHAPATELPRPSKFYLYLLLGQSNVIGKGRVDAQDTIPVRAF